MGINVTKAQLEQMDEEYRDSLYKMVGYGLMSSPLGIDASRLSMLSQHLKHMNVLFNPDVPRIRTGFEKTFANLSHGYRKIEGNWAVVDKIYKYKENGIYMLVLYNKKTDTYDMIEKPFAESFPEKQGYLYNTKFMDQLVVGDRVEDGSILYKSTSFDDNMNYRYGKTAKVVNITTNSTLEDALKIRLGWAAGVQYAEIDHPIASVNTNDIPRNIHSKHGKDYKVNMHSEIDGDYVVTVHENDIEDYKVIPDIGESVNGNPLFVTNRINTRHMLTEFQSQEINKITSLDSEYVTGKNAILYDIDIYYNGKEEFPDNVFFHQLKWYYDKRMAYMKQVSTIAAKIMESGSKFTSNVSYFKDLYTKDDGYRWFYKKEFDYMVIEFHTVALNPLSLGSKLTGRYGNKGVISEFANDIPKEIAEQIVKSFNLDMTIDDINNMNLEFVPDESMPFTDEGPIDICFDTSAAVRRLIMDAPHEVEINFISSRIQKRIRELPTFEEKKELAFDYLKVMNEYDCEVLAGLFDHTESVDGYTIRYIAPKWEHEFIEAIEENGFYICKPPHFCIRYDEIKALYNRYPWIEPIQCYINAFGRKIPIMNKLVVGEMHVLILKQNTNKNFSARSTYRMNRTNLPAKDNAKKTNRAPYSKTPIKLSEIYNLFAALSGRDIAEFNIYMRSSTLGRKALGQILAAKGNPLSIKKLKLSPEFINTNAQMLKAKLKVLGIGLDFITEDMLEGTGDLYDEYPILYTVDKYQVYDIPENRKMYQHIFQIYHRVKSEMDIMGDRDVIENLIWDKVFTFTDTELSEYPITEDVKAAVRLLTVSAKSIEVVNDMDDGEDAEDKTKRKRRTKAQMRKEKD